MLLVLAVSLYGAAHRFLAVPLVQRISDAVERETGRQLEIADIGLTLAIDPIVTIRGVRLDNADWGTSEDLFSADRIAIVVNGPRLFAARVDVKSIEVVGADVALETAADGDHNWHIAALARASHDLRVALENGRLTLERAVLETVRVSYRTADRPRVRHFALDRASATVDPRVEQTTIVLRNRVAGQQAQVSARLAYSEEPVGVDLEASFAGAILTATGGLAVEETGPSKLELQAKGPELAALGVLFGVTPPALGKFSASGTLTAHETTFELADLALDVGASDLSGTVSVSTGDRTRIDADLSAATFDVAPFFPPEPADPEEPAGGDTVPTSHPARARGLGAATLSVPNTVDVKGKLSVQRIVKGELTIEALTAIASVEAGRLELSRFEMKHGEAWLRASVNVGAGTEPAIDATALLQDFDVGRFLREASVTDTVAGELDVGLKVSTNGNTRDFMVANLGGAAGVVMGKGRIPSRYVDLLATDLANIIQPWRHGAHETSIDCALAQFDLAAGTMTSRSLLFDTKTMTMTGEWKIDLASDENDAVLKPRPKDPTITLAQDLHVTGTFGHLKVRPTKSTVMKDAAEAAIAGVLLGPAGLAVPFASVGAGHHHPCVDELRKTFGESIAKELGKQPG